MRKKSFLKICIFGLLGVAGFIDLGFLVVIGTYEVQFFWMYLLLTGLFYTLGVVGTIKEKYALLYIFAGYIIVYRCLDIALRTMNIIKTNHTTEDHTTAAPREKRDVLIGKDGKCCLFGSENKVEYLIASCCHNSPQEGDDISKVCQMAGFGKYAYRCEERSGRNLPALPEEPKKTKGMSFFAIFYCVRTTFDVALLFFVLLLAYILQYKK